jgi:hypothetical protein
MNEQIAKKTQIGEASERLESGIDRLEKQLAVLTDKTAGVRCRKPATQLERLSPCDTVKATVAPLADLIGNLSARVSRMADAFEVINSELEC